jgi:hypothetical protein
MKMYQVVSKIGQVVKKNKKIRINGYKYPFLNHKRVFKKLCDAMPFMLTAPPKSYPHPYRATLQALPSTAPKPLQTLDKPAPLML